MRKHRREAILDAYQLAFAAFLFASPWLFAFSHAKSGIDDAISAALVGASSLAALLIFREWEEWVNILLGLWILISPWVLDFHVAAATHVNVVVGILITYMSLLELWLAHYGPSARLQA